MEIPPPFPSLLVPSGPCCRESVWSCQLYQLTDASLKWNTHICHSIPTYSIQITTEMKWYWNEANFDWFRTERENVTKELFLSCSFLVRTFFVFWDPLELKQAFRWRRSCGDDFKQIPFSCWYLPIRNTHAHLSNNNHNVPYKEKWNHI